MKEKLKRIIKRQINKENVSDVLKTSDGILYQIFVSKKRKENYIRINGVDVRVSILNIPSTIDGISVEVIKKGAFSGNKEMIQVTIPEGVRLVGAEAFKDCVALETVNLPHDLKIINKDCFNGCVSLSQIHLPYSLKKICSNAFKNCMKIAGLKLPENVNEIAENAFDDLFKVEDNVLVLKNTINVESKNDIELVKEENQTEDGILYEINEDRKTRKKYVRINGIVNNYASKKIVVPNEIDGVDVEVIKREAFENNETIREILLPNTVRVIGTKAFKNCRNLKKVELPPDLEVINESTFEDCILLQTVVLPYELKNICKFAFRYCKALKELYHYVKTGIGITMSLDKSLKESKLPSGLINIGKSAFEGCMSIEDIYIPYGVKSISNASFKDCIQLKRVRFHNKVDKIAEEAFWGCDELKEVRLPDRIKKIEEKAFSQKTKIICNQNGYKQLEFHNSSLEKELVGKAIISLDSRMTNDSVKKCFYDKEDIENAIKLYEIRTPMDSAQKYKRNILNISSPCRFNFKNGVYENKKPSTCSSIKIMMTGDLMCSWRQIGAAYDGNNYEFEQGFKYVKEIFERGDLVVGNMEAMVSNSFVYSNKSRFVDDRVHLNAPDSFLSSIKNAGYDVVVNAQNHAYDTGTRGVFETLDALNRAQLIHTGIFAGMSERRFLIFSISGIKIALISYFDQARQAMKRANFTREGLKTLFSTFNEEQVANDINAAKEEGAEFVIAYCHCGREYTDKITNRQESFVKMVANNGADYIFGSHSHCLQPYSVIRTDDGRNVPVLYSGGNFFSDMSIKMPYVRDTLILELELCRNDAGNVEIKSEGYYPCLIKFDKNVRGNMVTIPITKLLEKSDDKEALKQDVIRIKETVGNCNKIKCFFNDNEWKEDAQLETEMNNSNGTVIMGPMNGPKEKHPDTIIEICEILGVPLPESAICGYQPSKYIGEDIGINNLSSIKNALGSYFPQVSERELKKEYSQFRFRFKNQKNLKFTNSDLTIYFCDWLVFARIKGFSYACYFDYELYNKEENVRDTFLNEGYRRRVYRACVTKEYKEILSNKAMFNKTFAKFVKREWVDTNTCSYDEFVGFVKRSNNFIAKPVLGTGGGGIERIYIDSATSLRECFEYCRNNNYIVEEIIHQHKTLAEFNESTLNTIRVTTLLCADNIPRIVLATARFGRLGNVVDNFHGGGVGAVVDIDTGKIISEAIDRNHQRNAFHPDSRKRILGFQYPEWEKIRDVVSEAALMLPEMRNIGWDVAVTNKGDVELVEGNGFPNYDVLQSPDQIGRRFRYEPYLEEIEKMKGIKNEDTYEIKKTKIDVAQSLYTNDFFKIINETNDVKNLDYLEQELIDKNIMSEFWKNYKVALYSKSEVLRKKARIKCRYIAFQYGAIMPFSKNINRFKTPHGLRGIGLSQYAKIGKDCTIYQHAMIGAVLLSGSKNGGFPEVGNNVSIGMGAKIIGNVKIGDNVRIGPNCVVADDIPANSIVVLSKPVVIKKEGNLDNRFIPASKFKKEYLD